ncbi:Variant-specific surface protein [Giardia duodenalis]|uniref:Variant-specific surface protein n=1 Tax=Giardia intestinalis TaxID=5741 RepID=V6T7W2_GIAIN|nr:Variant-specific surface protein [Giardia intestinalis]
MYPVPRCHGSRWIYGGGQLRHMYSTGECRSSHMYRVPGGYFLHMGNCHRREPGAGMQAPDPVLCPEAVSGPGNCKPGKCFGIGGEELSYCSQCADATEVPLNGACDNSEETQSCTQMSEGVCTSPAPGYFVLPADDRDAFHQSVVSCGDGEGAPGRTKLYKGVEGCAECTLSVPATTATCNRCTTKNLSPLKDACLTDCPAGTYLDSTGDNGNTCRLCHKSCASCSNNAETSCTACYPEYVLNRTSGDAGKCIPECTGDFMAHCAAGQCTAVVGGSKYCSRRKAGFAPVDGVCVSTTTRAPTGCTPGTDGTCTACTDTYFLQSGGCYQSTKYPGNTLCSNAAGGKCTQCTNGQTADGSSGSCPACDPTCKTCTAKENPNACSACFSGYYKSGTKCIACDKDDGSIKGVPNCLSCKEPASSSGAVTCYVKTNGTNNGGSTNKSGLSTGAIAGISVAAVVVVGGLVGFLCWWFLCRGKA